MPNTNETTRPTRLPWVQGNMLTLALPLTIVHLGDTPTTEDYEPQQGDTISVFLKGLMHCKEYTPTVDGNVLYITDNGELEVDSYSVEVVITEASSPNAKRRSRWNYIVDVYDSNEKVVDFFDNFPDWGQGAILQGSIFYGTGGGGGGVQSDWNETNTSSLAYIKNKPNLATVATSGSYNDLSNKPTIPAAQVQADWNVTSTSSKAFIKNKPTIPAAQVNSDWNATSGVAQILNKPTIPDVSGKEDTSNKTSDISSNKTNTTKYPTTKGVADYAEAKMAIVAASGTTLTASVDNYYLFSSEVGTLAITLTTPSDTTHITKAVFMLTTGSSPAVTFAGASGINVIAQDGFSIEASTTYEINAIYNGVAWVVAAMKLSSTPINS